MPRFPPALTTLVLNVANAGVAAVTSSKPARAKRLPGCTLTSSCTLAPKKAPITLGTGNTTGGPGGSGGPGGTGGSGATTTAGAGAGSGAGAGAGSGTGSSTTAAAGAATATTTGLVANRGATGGATKPGSLTSASRSSPAPSSCKTPALEIGGPESPASDRPATAAERAASAPEVAERMFVVAALRAEAMAVLAAATPGPSAGTRKKPTAEASKAVKAASSGKTLPSPGLLPVTLTVMGCCAMPPSWPAPCTVKLIC